MTRRYVATWLGCSDVTEAQATAHCRKQGLTPKETKQFMRWFAEGKKDWEAMQ